MGGPKNSAAKHAAHITLDAPGEKPAGHASATAIPGSLAWPTVPSQSGQCIQLPRLVIRAKRLLVLLSHCQVPFIAKRSRRNRSSRCDSSAHSIQWASPEHITYNPSGEALARGPRIQRVTLSPEATATCPVRMVTITYVLHLHCVGDGSSSPET